MMLSIPEDISAQEDYDYYCGMVDGYKDASIVALPVKTGEHTWQRYCDISDKYTAAIFAFEPTDYQRGYGDGFDRKAEDLGYLPL